MERYYLAAVCAALPSMSMNKLLGLLERFGGARQLWNSSFEEWLAAGAFTEKQLENLADYRKTRGPEQLEAFCRKQGVRLMTYLDEDYPIGLKYISDYPLVLYVRGTLPQSDYSMAVVGSRSCTSYGHGVTELFSRALAASGIPIISGGARGIDTAAHKAALEVKGTTVVVLGCGIDKAYPAENLKLFQEIVQKGGAVLSEFAPGMPPLKNNFPRRNRIIVGLAKGVLVTECKLKSGAMITANIAADEGRDVYCVPGSIHNEASAGCHYLIRNGAQLVNSPADILTDLEEWHGYSFNKPGQSNIFDFLCPADGVSQDDNYEDRNQEERALLSLLSKGRLTLSEIIEKQEGSLASLSTVLLDLQVAGLIGQDNAQRYYLK